jgi:hypothetical protein
LHAVPLRELIVKSIWQIDEQWDAAGRKQAARKARDETARLSQAGREDLPVTPGHAAAEAAGEHFHNPEACGDEFRDGDEIGMRRVRRTPGEGNDQDRRDWAEVWEASGAEKRGPGGIIRGQAGPTVTRIPQGQPEAASINRPNPPRGTLSD